MKAGEVLALFENECPMPDYKKVPVDGFKVGGPDDEVHGIATCWMSTQQAIDQARERGLDLIITHEPTFFTHRDVDDDDTADIEHIQAKRRDLEANGPTIFRMHDRWDTFPEYGILDSWSKACGLGERADFDGRIGVYDLADETLGSLAARMKKGLGLSAIRFNGDPESSVRRVGIGVGGWGSMGHMKMALAMGADCFATGASGEIRVVRLAQEMGVGVIVAGHGECEEPGMKSMAGWLRPRIPDTIPIQFLTNGPGYRFL